MSARHRGPREAMVDSAILLFRERGVAATSLRDVVAHSGAPRGSIYHHFPGGKAELAEAATRRAGDIVARLLGDLAAVDDPDRAVDLVVGHWGATLVASDFTEGCPVAAAALSPDETSNARAAAGAAFAQWEDALATALVARGVADDRARSLAVLVVCAIEGALLVGRAQRSEAALRAVGHELVAALRSAAT